MILFDNIIDKLLSGKNGFALFRLPGETKCHVMLQDHAEEYSMPENWKDQAGYLIHGFGPDLERLWITADHYSMLEMTEFENRWEKKRVMWGDEKLINSGTNYGKNTEKEDYEVLFNKSKAFLNSDGEKVVISRCKNVKLDLTWDVLFNAFIKAGEKYPQAYVSLVFIPGEGYWFGATPEVFLEKRDGLYMIDALAGSLPIIDIDKPIWRDKEIEEQRFVAEYVKNVLNMLQISNYEIDGPESICAGPVWHLRTRFRLNNVPDVEKLISVLHPTPAVCGTPRNDAYEFINNNEDHKRGWYSGYWGPVNFNKAKDLRLYVNLRCLHADSGCLTLFAGGGITKASKLEEEWAETEFKMKTLMDVIAS